MAEVNEKQRKEAEAKKGGSASAQKPTGKPAKPEAEPAPKH
jgi:hypothetical protein